MKKIVVPKVVTNRMVAYPCISLSVIDSNNVFEYISIINGLLVFYVFFSKKLMCF
jgi:hypothetical protein